MRKKIPLNAVRAFEVAARHMSFTGAAEELNVTQVAVSRQIRSLEDYLEIPLFERRHRTITLTEEGARLFPAITQAIEDIDRAVSSVSMRGKRNVLLVQSYTTFGHRWLIPRLSRFHKQFPNIDIRLTASTQPVNFERQNLHAVIRTGNGEFENCDCDFLAPLELVPVCSPGLAKSWTRQESVETLRRQTLLHSLARPNDWAMWLSSAGVKDVDPGRGLKFENSVLAYEAALQGIGVAMGVRVLVDQFLRLGSLVAPFEHVLPLDTGYYLVIPRGRPMSVALRDFRRWLLEEAQVAQKG